MSWQSYVDQQLMGSGVVAKAIIAGHDGTLWAKSGNVNVSFLIILNYLLSLCHSLAGSTNLCFLPTAVCLFMLLSKEFSF